MLSLRYLSVFGASVLSFWLAASALAADPQPVHGLAMHGTPKYGPEFTHFDYVNPDAPKGGAIKAEASGTFDSFNTAILKGTPAAGLGLIYDTLTVSSLDEAFTRYGLLAEVMEMPEDRSWVSFTLHPDARWHDGVPVTPRDVIWTYETIMAKGHPFYRAYYAGVAEVKQTGPRTVTFLFSDATNRELPLILGELAILPEHYWRDRDFGATTLEPPLGSGAYRIKSFEAGRSIAYERVKDYWAADLPVSQGHHNVDEIRYEYYRDRDVATEAFKSGAFDLRSENSSKRWAKDYDFAALDAGMVIREEVSHKNPSGMQGFVFNLRKPIFADPKVRAALTLAWDFEWTNATIMYDAYTRTNSYFSNSELSAENGLPEGEELEILERFRDQLPPRLFTEIYQAPKSDGSGNNRRNLGQALKLLGEAGWQVREGKLTGPDGTLMAFEMLLVQPSLERIVLPFQQSLARLGVEMSVRTVDPAQYQNRVQDFDFDMIVASFGASSSPGNEQRDFWYSTMADTPGSRNLAGIKSPVIDALVELVIAAPTRESLVARARALDRVLLGGHYVIPHFHIRAARLIYWNRFARPPISPQYAPGGGYPTIWWIDPDRAAALNAWRTARRQ